MIVEKVFYAALFVTEAITASITQPPNSSTYQIDLVWAILPITL